MACIILLKLSVFILLCIYKVTSFRRFLLISLILSAFLRSRQIQAASANSLIFLKSSWWTGTRATFCSDMVAGVEEELALEVDGEADGVESSDLEYDICKETFSLQESRMKIISLKSTIIECKIFNCLLF